LPQLHAPIRHLGFDMRVIVRSLTLAIDLKRDTRSSSLVCKPHEV
jgi:hypothetical protein